MQREDHPYDNGYWARFDGKFLEGVTTDQERQGWLDCDAELRFERANVVTTAHKNAG